MQVYEIKDIKIEKYYDPADNRIKKYLAILVGGKYVAATIWADGELQNINIVERAIKKVFESARRVCDESI